MGKALREYNNLSVTEKRISYLLGARLKESDKITAAIEKQDEIRKKYAAPQGWDSVAIIRKWREAR
mgnify:CR=1 FL=1